MGRHVSRPSCLRARLRPLRFGLQNAVLGLSNTSALVVSGLWIEQLFRVIVIVEYSDGK